MNDQQPPYPGQPEHPEQPEGSGQQYPPYSAPQPGTGGYGQNPYGQNPYGQTPYGQPAYGAPVRTHPQATAVLVLGIVSLVLCGLAGPVAWVMGGRARKEIDASQGQLGGRQQVTIGWVLGIIATILLVGGLVLALGLFTVALSTSS